MRIVSGVEFADLTTGGRVVYEGVVDGRRRDDQTSPVGRNRGVIGLKAADPAAPDLFVPAMR